MAELGRLGKPTVEGGTTLDRIGRYARQAREYISPWNVMSPTDVASMAPGGGFVNAWQDSGRARDNLKAGNYGQAAIDYGNMALNMAGEVAPFAKLAIFAGPAAKTANLAELARAKTLANRGIEPWTVHHETGWFQGADGGWRFEIPDNKAKIDVAGRSPENQFYLSSVMRHPEIYEAYPQLADIKTTVRMDPKGGTSGSWSARDGEGFITAKAPTQEDMKSALLHEMQHAVQNLERFSPGANLKNSTPENYRVTAGEVEARNTEKRRNWTAEDRRSTPPWETEDTPREKQVFRAYRK